MPIRYPAERPVYFKASVMSRIIPHQPPTNTKRSHIQHPASSIQYPVSSSIQHQTSSIKKMKYLIILLAFVACNNGEIRQDQTGGTPQVASQPIEMKTDSI